MFGKLVVTSLILFFPLMLGTASASASEMRIAVASNFATTAQALVDEYSSSNDDAISLLVGSTGKHVSQIRHGLPASVFLAADVRGPALLERKGFAIKGTRFSYALGRLALWSKDASLVDENGDVLSSSEFSRLAIANPNTAPYGIAAKDVIATLGISPKLVLGESIGQAFQFASSGAAELALLAVSQVVKLDYGSLWLVPSHLHRPIDQQAVLLKDTAAARRFLSFLKSERALRIIESHGYLRPNLR